MCGIAGWVGGKPAAELDDQVATALRLMRHRGPDAARVLHFAGTPYAVLASTRLRIRDLSASADMPLTDAEGRFSLVYNGELYNAGTLRAELASNGYAFRTESDSECVLNALIEGRSDVGSALRRLEGIFALAFWDDEERRLVLARDRLGVKPLVYASSPSGVWFASESRALVGAGAAPDAPSLDAVAAYLRFGWIPHPATFYDAVSQLPPASVYEITERSRTIREWWRPQPHGVTVTSRADAVEVVRHEVREAVRRQLVSDRPVGVFLSGGVDSGAVSAIAAEFGVPRGITVTFPDNPELSEEREAKQTSARFGIEHVSVPVTGREFAEVATEAIGAFDQPTVNGLNTWIVSRAAASTGLVVALSGLGGDELFSGYGLSPSFEKAQKALRLLGLLPASTRRTVA